MFRRSLRQNWTLVFISASVFLLGVGVGFVLGWNSIRVGQTVSAFGSGPTPDSTHQSPAFFFLHNVQVAAMLWTGAITLAASTVLNTFFNGVVTGTIVYFSLERLTVPQLAAVIVPHGIVEYPGVWVAGAAGLKIPSELLAYVRKQKEYVLNRAELAEVLALALVSVGLLAVAAIIEATITSRLATIVLG